MTLSSQYKVSSIQNLRPSRLSTRSVQFKIYDPLVSVQGLGLYMHLFYCLLFSKLDEISVFVLTYLLLR